MTDPTGAPEPSDGATPFGQLGQNPLAPGLRDGPRTSPDPHSGRKLLLTVIVVALVVVVVILSG